MSYVLGSDVALPFSSRQPFIAGIYLMMSVDTVIPPGKTGENLLLILYRSEGIQWKIHDLIFTQKGFVW